MYNGEKVFCTYPGFETGDVGMDFRHPFTHLGSFSVELTDQLVGGVVEVLCAEFRIVGPGGTGPCMDGETSLEVMSIGPAD